MRLPQFRSRAFLGIMLIAPAAAHAQNVPVRTLSKPEVEYSEPFTALMGIRELKDGRVITVDPRDKVVQVLDLRTGSAEKVGREGNGPGEYALPQRVYALPGDSSAVFDPLNRRLLVIEPSGKTGGFIELSAGSGGGGRGMVMMGGASLSAVDRTGRFYAQGMPFQVTDAGPQMADSVAIERFARGSTKRDTIGFLKVPKGNAQASGGRGQFSIRIGGGNPFTPTDQWAAAPDGRVAIVSASDYHVDWIDASGRRTRTPAIRFEKIKVTAQHKQEWRDRMKNAMGMQVSDNNGRRSAQMVPVGTPQEPPDWPEYLPPFLAAGMVSFAPDGLLWVARTTAAGAPPTFDLIDGAGKVAQRVVLPKKTRLVGFGNGTVYLVRSDDDDLQYLQRYRFSAAERP